MMHSRFTFVLGAAALALAFSWAKIETVSAQACSSFSTAQPCNDNFCFWDPYANQCFASLTVANNLNPCSFWSNKFEGDGSNPACAYHGCAYDDVERVCSLATSQGSNQTSNSTVSSFASKVTFVNPQVLANSVTFQVEAVVPYVYSRQSTFQPRYPVFQILAPVSSGLAERSREVSPTCSSYNDTGFVSPMQFFTDISDATLQSYLSLVVNSQNNLIFDNSPNGAVFRKVFGNPSIGPNVFTRRVTYDGTQFRYLLQFDLTAAARDCASRGASQRVTGQSTNYQIPLSLVEHTINGLHTQATQTFDIQISTTGQVSIGVTAQYHIRGFPTAVTFPQATCPTNSALMQIIYQLEVRDVFDPSTIVGPRNVSDIVLRSPASPPGPVNCYGDQVTELISLGCNYSTYTCTYQYTTQSKCRTLTADGQAFIGCSYANPADRVADLGSDIPYSTALNSVHQTFVYPYTCGLNGANCVISTTSPAGNPDSVRAVLATSNYLAASTLANPFQVAGGILPFSSAGTGDFNQLTNSEGQGVNVSRFDGNVFSNQPVTVITLLPEDLRTIYDLRVRIDNQNVTIYPLNTFGQRLGALGPDYNTTAYTGPSFLNWRAIAASVLFTTKNAFDQGCGAAGECFTLPACLGLLGCDGFSIPVSQLEARAPANGYMFQVNYIIGLTNADGSTPNAGALFQTLAEEEQAQPVARFSTLSFAGDEEEGDTEVYESKQRVARKQTVKGRVHKVVLNGPTVRRLLQTTQSGVVSTETYQGTLIYTVRIDEQGNVTEVEVSTPFDNIVIEFNKTNVFLMVEITLFVALLILYFLLKCFWKCWYRKHAC